MKRLWLIVGLLMLIVVLLFVGRANTSKDKSSREIRIPVLSETAEVLKPEHFKSMRKAFNSEPHYRQMRNAVTVTAIDEIALDRSIVTGIDDSFSHKLDDWPVTNQVAAGSLRG